MRHRQIPEGSTFGAELVKALYEYAAGAGIPLPPPDPAALARWGGMFFIFPNYFVLPQYGNALVYRVRPNGDDPESCRVRAVVAHHPRRRRRGPAARSSRVPTRPTTPTTGRASRCRTSPISGASNGASTVCSFDGLRLSHTYEARDHHTCTASSTAIWPRHWRRVSRPCRRTIPDRRRRDVVVVGTGAAALTAAITAHDAGRPGHRGRAHLVVGGTTAVSGGGIWMPQNHHMAERGDRRLAGGGARLHDPAHRRPHPARAARALCRPGPGHRGRHREAHPPATRRRCRGPTTTPRWTGPSRRDGCSSRRCSTPSGSARGRPALRRPPVLGLPITLQEATVDWRPTYFPERFDAAEVQRRVADHQVACGQALIGALLEACLVPGHRAAARDPGLRDRHATGTRVAGLVVEQWRPPSEIPAAAVVLASGGYEWNAQLRVAVPARPADPSPQPAGQRG